MSYLQINIGGKLRGLKFNQLAIEILGTHSDSKTTTGFVYAMIYAGLKGNSYVKLEEPDYTFEEVCDWIDVMEDKEKVILDVTNTMTSTQSWKDLASKATSEPEEKKKRKGNSVRKS